MTKETPYFRPRNWHKFQSRSNNSMAWVKIYTGILSDPEYGSLTENQKLTWLELLLLFGRTGRPLPLDSQWIGAQLARDSRAIGRALPALQLNNFIELCGRTAKLHNIVDSPREEERRIEKKESPRPPTEGSLPKPNGKLRKGSRLPEDWQPTEAEIAYARERGFDETAIRDIAGDFHTYWTAGNGRNKTHADWTRCWQTWVRKERPRNNRPAAHDAGGDRLGHGSLAAAMRRNLV